MYGHVNTCSLDVFTNIIAFRSRLFVDNVENSVEVEICFYFRFILHPALRRKTRTVYYISLRIYVHQIKHLILNTQMRSKPQRKQTWR